MEHCELNIPVVVVFRRDHIPESERAERFTHCGQCGRRRSLHVLCTGVYGSH